ncbi:uncharacterized protein LOC141911262 [Tubulanus polymorphus]|uniref:uncharacterized protein LOC141911262 n=1 Tax=Tubulanus polymorphus TaxID=672921 RepID=UPI003DA24123
MVSSTTITNHILGFFSVVVLVLVQDTLGIKCNLCAYNSEYEEGYPTVVGVPMSKKCMSEPDKTRTCETPNGHCFKRVAYYPNGKQFELFYGCEPKSLGCEHKTKFPDDGTYALKYCCWSNDFCNDSNRLSWRPWTTFLIPTFIVLLLASL